MFRQLFNFGYQRTALQALGWYLFFLLLAVLLGGLADVVAVSFGYVSGDDFMGNMRVGEQVAPVIPVMVGVVLLAEKPFTPTSLIVTLIAFVFAFLLGWFGAGIPLAFLTTRPSREPENGQPVELRNNAWRR